MVQHIAAARNAEKAAALRAAFSHFDKDKSGTLTIDELVGIMTHPGTSDPMTRKEARAFIKRYDLNHDGVIDLDEFTKACSISSATPPLMAKKNTAALLAEPHQPGEPARAASPASPDKPRGSPPRRSSPNGRGSPVQLWERNPWRS